MNGLLYGSLGLNLLLAAALIFCVIRAKGRNKPTLEKEKRGELFLKTVTHDLRSPLANIKGYADALCAGEIPEDRREESLCLISSEAERLAGLAGRLSAGENLSLSPSVFDLGSLLHLTVLSLTPKAGKKGVFFREEGYGPDEPVYVRADRQAIHEAIYNLCDNAVKYSDPGEAVTLRISREEGEIRCDMENICRDFQASDAEKLFQPGFRGVSGEKSPGMGLGLYISRQIFDAHKKSLRFQSVPPVCAFRFWLDKAPDSNLGDEIDDI